VFNDDEYADDEEEYMLFWLTVFGLVRSELDLDLGYYYSGDKYNINLLLIRLL
jgi:hypothetical protein